MFASISGHPLEFLRNQPQFQQMRQIIQQNPSLLPALLQQIGRENPQLLQVMIHVNLENGVEMLFGLTTFKPRACVLARHTEEQVGI